MLRSEKIHKGIKILFLKTDSQFLFYEEADYTMDTKKAPLLKAPCNFNGADGGNRTLMGSPHAPQTCASTNSATSAFAQQLYPLLVANSRKIS